MGKARRRLYRVGEKGLRSSLILEKYAFGANKNTAGKNAGPIACIICLACPLECFLDDSEKVTIVLSVYLLILSLTISRTILAQPRSSASAILEISESSTGPRREQAGQTCHIRTRSPVTMKPGYERIRGFKKAKLPHCPSPAGSLFSFNTIVCRTE